MYVSLEPCSHYGKTPPCADLIIKHQIPNVVIGCVDSFSEVSGRGIERLKQHGCIVTVGVLEEECIDLNKRFFTFHNLKRPYIILKWAQTKNGFIAPEDNDSITWITNSYSRQLVHKLRAEEQAILIGTNTAITDNPKLNCRNWFGASPIRIILDRSLKVSKQHHIYDGSVKTIIVTNHHNHIDNLTVNNLFIEHIDFSKSIAQQICDILYKHQIQSLIIEGGSQTLQTFIDENLWDEAQVYTGTNTFKQGIKSPELDRQLIHQNQVLEDNISIYYND